MKEIVNRRVLSIFLVLSVSISLMVGISVPVSAVAMETVTASVATYETLKKVVGLQESVSKSIADAVDFEFTAWDVVEPEVLERQLQSYNYGGWFGRFLASYPDAWETIKGFYHFVSNDANVPSEMMIQAYPDPAQNNIYRPWIRGLGWFVDVNGKYPYCSRETWEAYLDGMSSDNPPPSVPVAFDGRWLTTNSIRDSKKLVQKSYADLDTTKADLANKYPNSSVTISTLKVGGLECKVIRRLEEGPGNRDWVWCDPNGRPYVYIDPATQGAAQDWNYDKIQEITNNQTQDIKDIVTEQGDKIDKLIDLDSNVTIAPSLSVDPSLEALLKLNIDKVVIDRSDNGITYTVDSHDVTYNTELNYYEYNYYTYNYEYTYNNTYVTYIGSTAEYQPKEWAFYYELPDGRSSADLTEEDIAGLSFQFADMVNYKRSATDTSLRALYHFDGSLEDSSYWSTQGAFNWNKGASITYMESNAFNGALYLDEKEHQFTITLPSNIGSGDFSLQWRYYQNSATTTDHNENYVSIGGTKLLGWSEQSLYSLATAKLGMGLSVGTWQELALVRDNGRLYMYHNGVQVNSAAMTTVFNDKITFYLGANSRAHSMIDELRFVNFAIVKGGAAYTPTAVPYDTNSVLVLPDGAQPVADEFWKWDTKIKPTYTFDLTTGFLDIPSRFSSNNSIGYYEWRTDDLGSWYRGGPVFVGGNDQVVVNDGYTSFIGKAPSVSTYTPYAGFYDDEGNATFNIRTRGIAILLPSLRDGYGFSDGNYTFTLVDRSLKRYSLTVGIMGGTADMTPGSTVSFDWGSMTVSKISNVSCLYLLIDPGKTLDLVYLEAVPGTKANTDHEFISAVYSSDELQPNTAAIQSAIPVNGYTVGGVRPTFPQRGDVWMPVEGSRISGVYIYNGQAWEETNARYWTGKRWIPIYAFDLVTLADMWDVGSSTGEDVLPSITSEYGFWNWWKQAWLSFTEKLYKALGICDHTYTQKVVVEPTCMKKGLAVFTCTKCGKSYTDSVPALGHDWLLVESVPDDRAPGYEDITDNFVPSFTIGPFATMVNLLDGDPSTVYSGKSRMLNFQLSSTNVYSNLDMVTKVELDFVIDGDLITFPVLTPLPHYNGNENIRIPINYNENLLCEILFQYPSSASGPFVFRVESSDYFSYALDDGFPAFAEIRFYTDGLGDPIPGTGYDLYRCSVCGEEYADYDGSGPPSDIPDDDPTPSPVPSSPSGSGDGSGSIPDGSLPGEDEGEDGDSWSVFDLLKALKDGAWALVKGTVKTVFGGIKGVVGVVADITGFFSVAGDVSDAIKDFGG